jgi:hypothetical protein
VDLGHGGGSNVKAASSALGAGSIGGVSALMALRGVGGAEARSRALRKGRRLLDALDRLQVALLSEGPTRAHRMEGACHGAWGGDTWIWFGRKEARGSL